jgi:hypothetical protein
MTLASSNFQLFFTKQVLHNWKFFNEHLQIFVDVFIVFLKIQDTPYFTIALGSFLHALHMNQVSQKYAC